MKNLWWKQEKYQILTGLIACLVLIFIWYQSISIKSFYGAEGYGYIRAADANCRTIDVFVNATDLDAENFEPVYGAKPKIRVSEKLIKVEQPWPRVFGFTLDTKNFKTLRFSAMNSSSGESVTNDYRDLRKDMDTCLQDPESYQLKIDENNNVTKSTFCNMVRRDVRNILQNCGKTKPVSITDRANGMLQNTLQKIKQ